MKRKLPWVLTPFVMTLTLGYCPGEEEVKTDETAIRDKAKAYVEAFNSHNVEALAKHYSNDAVYLDRSTDETVTGRAAIAEQFTELFKAQPKVALELNIESINFLSPGVAIEHGRVKRIVEGEAPEETPYSAVHVKQGEEWLLDRVTDEIEKDAISNHEHLKSLEWMVGDWVDQDDQVRVETHCEWTKNRNFLTRSFTIILNDEVDLAGMQIVGWDPIAKIIRSWTFDSDGGFAEGTWTNEKDRWYIRNKGYTADGRVASMVNILRPVDENTFGWKTTERTSDGTLAPDTEEVVIVRE